MILETLFTMALFITGGYVIDTRLGLHRYNNEDYKEISLLRNKDSIYKHCIRHSRLENIKKIKSYRSNVDDGGMVTKYKIHDPYPHQDTPGQDTFNSQRINH